MTTVTIARRYPSRGPALTMDARRHDDENPDGSERGNLEEGRYGDISKDGREKDQAALLRKLEQMNRDDEEEGEAGEKAGVVARYPSTYHAQFEDDELVIYSEPPDTQNLAVDRRSYRRPRANKTSDRRPPQTLAQLNEFHARHYRRHRGGR